MKMRQHTSTKSSWHGIPSRQHVWKLANSLEVSVICNAMSYGHQSGLWELAVFDKYNSVIKNEGFLRPLEVREIIRDFESQ